ncbi:MAG: PspC domain-containing protein [Saprospiraceae bacterium]|nr:PspC domain-containing protein [Saprospiraceae bacterium]MCB9314239.1 PspC domain-containing protein [Lewinellaceae bacterium]HRW76350.1 PspC domain-containing protein [Saprospiraceae bacterium]
MNKVININLGGQPFTIDDDAYSHLDVYLKAVRQSFHHLEGKDEILGDIEIRMAELLTSQLGVRKIVSSPDVDAVIRIMGKPEQFEEEVAEEQQEKRSYKSTSHEFNFRPGKRLYRDPEDKIVGGVCSGLAAYLGIHDPVWVRLAFALLFFSGIGIIPYLVMMVLVPKAETAADRLDMKGEPVNIQSIADAVEKQFQEISDKLTELGNDLGRKKK